MRSAARWSAAGLVIAALAALAGCGGKPAARPRHDGGDAGAVAGDGRDAAAAPGPVTPDGAAAPYRLAALGADDAVVGAGTVAVTVIWPDAPPAVRASPGVTPCATPRPPRATIGALHGVAGAVVMIEGVVAGKRPPPAAPVRLTVRDCAIAPRIAIQPRIGATLEVQAQDDVDRAIAIGELGPAWTAAPAAAEAAGAQGVTRARLAGWGHTVSLPLAAAGVRRIEADGVADAAHVVVTDQPYAAVTGDDGAVALDQVPAGTHAVVAWLPPAADQPAQVARGQVTVVAGDKVDITLRLGS